LPIVACDTSIPLVEGSVRRSTRLNKTDGFCPVRLNREPTKKRKICVVQIDEKTGQARPLSIPILQGWGIDCGVAPSELSDEALMQSSFPNE